MVEVQKTSNFSKYFILAIGAFFFFGVLAVGVSRIFKTPEELAVEKRQRDSKAKAQGEL